MSQDHRSEPVTKEQIAAKAAEQISLLAHTTVRIMDIREKAKPIILAAINEAATPQVDWANAVEWPTEPGLWFMAMNAEKPLLVYVRSLDPEYCAVTDTADGNPFSFSPDTYKRALFIRCDIPLPAPPSLPAYIPSVGEWFWVALHKDSEWNPQPHQCIRCSEYERVTSVASAEREFSTRYHCFALAKVDPPPQIGGAI